MKTGFFAKTVKQFSSLEEKIEAVGWNTGNIVFTNSIINLLECEIVSEDAEEGTLSNFDQFITTELIWLRENVQPWLSLTKQLEKAGDKPLVPISIGLQSKYFKKDFCLHPEIISILKAMEEKTCFAVRGIYTYDILYKNGIRNMEVIGCPSLYQIPLYQNSFDFLKDYKYGKAVSNFRTFDTDLTEKEYKVLKYLSKNCDGFVEQTFDYIQNINGSDSEIDKWIEDSKSIYFDVDTWLLNSKKYNFSIGSRFHGNVMAILSGVPALFLAIDSRTKEMTNFFDLPSLEFEDFDEYRTMEYYRDSTNYDNFIKKYNYNTQNFISYLSKCNINISEKYKEKFSNFLLK
ncbi:polysaccharide pyruvyl transferase family protein [Acetobacter senegalensis]|uniref:polysaccharide pyruvyl transferase family protein n=1 Tax=Acetobacter senegalensis TaxID=446692 RepID=UPI001EDA29E6|nr:polysaccharide pyruvyl transferase family protein [Acetobacter senegalensis]MCG4272924.1 polysaccharide pyruvyl transferase family protein [Acetobacter senegalensis]